MSIKQPVSGQNRQTPHETRPDLAKTVRNVMKTGSGRPDSVPRQAETGSGRPDPGSRGRQKPGPGGQIRVPRQAETGSQPDIGAPTKAETKKNPLKDLFSKRTRKRPQEPLFNDPESRRARAAAGPASLREPGFSRGRENPGGCPKKAPPGASKANNGQ